MHDILNNQTFALTLFPAVQIVTGIICLWLDKRDMNRRAPLSLDRTEA